MQNPESGGKAFGRKIWREGVKMEKRLPTRRCANFSKNRGCQRTENMIAYVIKRKGARTYDARIRLGDEKRITQVPLGCTNRQVAEKKLRELLDEKGARGGGADRA